jgi:hypothetical protein
MSETSGGADYSSAAGAPQSQRAQVDGQTCQSVQTGGIGSEC